MNPAPRYPTLAIILLAVLLQACQTRPISSDGDDVWRSDPRYFTESESDVTERLEWRYSGKVGLTTASLKEQANLIWHYVDQANIVRLFGPLGAGAVKIEFDQFGARLSDQRGLIHQGNSAQSLLQEVVGWPLPVDALWLWLLARPQLDQPFEYRLNEQGQVRSLRQLDWQIDYQDYRDYDGRLLPRKLTAHKRFADPQHGEVKVKLITKNWR